MFCMWFEAFGSVTYSVYMYMLKCFNMLELCEGILKVLCLTQYSGGGCSMIAVGELCSHCIIIDLEELELAL